jgi:hypothetical protein
MFEHPKQPRDLASQESVKKSNVELKEAEQQRQNRLILGCKVALDSPEEVNKFAKNMILTKKRLKKLS